MKKLFKCTVCGFISEGEEAPEKCPKCNMGKEKYWSNRIILMFLRNSNNSLNYNLKMNKNSLSL